MDQFNLDTQMTGFGNKGAYNGERTPIHDKNSVLASKPYLGGKPRHQLIKSPDRNFTPGVNSDYYNYATAGTGLGADIPANNHMNIEEDIGADEEAYNHEQK